MTFGQGLSAILIVFAAETALGQASMVTPEDVGSSAAAQAPSSEAVSDASPAPASEASSSSPASAASAASTDTTASTAPTASAIPSAVRSDNSASPAAPDAGNEATKGTDATEIEPRFLLYGQGDVNSPDASFNESSAAAGVGLGFESDIFRMSILIRKGTRDEVGATLNEQGELVPARESAYGLTILDPASTNFSYLLNLAWYPKKYNLTNDLHARLGGRLYLAASNIAWSYAVQENDDSLAIRSVEVTPFGAGVCGSSYASSRIRGNIATLYGHLCASYRRMGGDLGNDGALRRQILGTNVGSYYGIEAESGIQVGNLSVGARVLVFSALRKHGSIDGLTDVRVIPFVSGAVPISFPVESSKK